MFVEVRGLGCHPFKARSLLIIIFLLHLCLLLPPAHGYTHAHTRALLAAAQEGPGQQRQGLWHRLLRPAAAALAGAPGWGAVPAPGGWGTRGVAGGAGVCLAVDGKANGGGPGFSFSTSLSFITTAAITPNTSPPPPQPLITPHRIWCSCTTRSEPWRETRRSGCSGRRRQRQQPAAAAPGSSSRAASRVLLPLPLLPVRAVTAGCCRRPSTTCRPPWTREWSVTQCPTSG